MQKLIEMDNSHRNGNFQLNRGFQSPVFNSGQKMALRALYVAICQSYINDLSAIFWQKVKTRSPYLTKNMESLYQLDQQWTNSMIVCLNRNVLPLVCEWRASEGRSKRTGNGRRLHTNPIKSIRYTYHHTGKTVSYFSPNFIILRRALSAVFLFLFFTS